MKPWKIIRDIICVLFVLGLIFANTFERRATRKRIEKELYERKVKAPDPSKGTPLFYSIQDDDWVYSNQVPAKEPNKEKEPYEDMEKYLQDRIPKYKEDTYWGEEWDWEDEEEEDEK